MDIPPVVRRLIDDRLLGKLFILAVVASLAGFLCIQTLTSALRANGESGFPLDDAWIHLQFARNLHDFGSFSFYKNEMVTAGSTSPLFTLLLAAGFFVTSDGLLLSHVVGIFSLLAAGI